MRKIILLVLTSLAGISLMSCQKDSRIQIGILQYATHGALDEARDGFIDALEENGFKDGDNVKITVYNPEGNASVMQTQVKSMVRKSDLILAIATSAAVAVFEEIKSSGKDIPLLFTAVTDPVDAGLVESMENPNRNVTGTSDMNPIDQQIGLILELLPNAKKIGVVYNNGEPNSIIQVDIVKDESALLDLEVLDGVVTDASNIKQVINDLILNKKVDAIYTPTDNFVASNMGALEEAILSLKEHKVPIIAGESSSVHSGASLTYSINYYDLGIETGKLAVKILNGEKAKDLSVLTTKEVDLILNKKQLDILEINIPNSLLEKASEIIE